MNMIYLPMIMSIFSVAIGALIYYLPKYEITDYNSINKYKISKNNILIKLKLFKYDNRFNYFLLIPYLLTWIIFFVVFILYVLYWYGLSAVGNIFVSKYFIFSYTIYCFILLVYSGFRDYFILNNYISEKFNFSEDKKNDNDKGGFI